MDIQQLVQLVLDGNFCTNQLWPDKGIVTEREEAKPLVEPNKELKGVMTDLVVYEFLNTSKQLCRFISTVYNTFNEAIKLYNSHMNLSDANVFFVYKGGNILRFVSNQVFYNMPGQVKNDLIAYYRDSFKKSDADFTIYINPALENFDKIFNDMTNLAYLLHNHLRNLFFANPTEYFNFYNLSLTAKEELLLKYLGKLNESEVIKQQIIPGSYVSLKLPSTSAYFTEKQTNLKYIPKSDFEIVFNKKANILNSADPNDPDRISSVARFSLKPIHLQQFDNLELSDLGHKQLPIYGDIWQSEFLISVNRTTSFMVSGGLISFNLIRSKISFNAERISGDQIILDKLDGELIDVSITNKGDYVVEKFFTNPDKHIMEYKLEEDDCTVSFRAYSIEYLIGDLENILFVQNAYPWDDPKYIKRLKRLLFMYYLSLFTTDVFSENSERILYLLALKENVLLPTKHYRGRKNTINDIDKFINDSSRFTEKIPIKNFIMKLRSMNMDKKLDGTKFGEFMDNIIENLEVLQKSLLDLNRFMINSGSIPEGRLYEGQLGGVPYFDKYRKYKNKYMQLKYKN